MTAPSLTDQDVAALRAITQTHLKADLAGDWAGWAATCTEDAVLMPPDHAVVEGRAAIEAWLERFCRIQEWSATVEAVGGSGDFAFTRGGTAPMTVEVEGVPTSTSVKWLAVFRKQPDGIWKMVADMWNANQPPSA